MVRLRRVPVLVSTLALVAGCGSADRVEVSGVVRDGRTGTPLAGARVTGADGVATHTDAEGRFTLAVMRGLRTQLRVSAEGHADAVQSFGTDAFVAPEILAFVLEPEDLVVEDVADPHAVVRWDTAPWISQRTSRGHAEAQLDGGHADSEGAWELAATRHCPASPTASERDVVSGDTPTDAPDEAIEVEGRAAPWLGAGSACVDCHRDDGAGNQANVVLGATGDGPGAHAGLGDSCLACHGIDGAARADGCARCHGEPGGGVGGDTLHRTWNIDVALTLDDQYGRTLARAREAMRRRTAPARLERWVEALERDGSRGAHDPRLVAQVAAALD